jgi:hypothetical protein
MLDEGRLEFALQVAKLDQRRKVDFHAIFPEYRDFLGECEELRRSPGWAKGWAEPPPPI